MHLTIVPARAVAAAAVVIAVQLLAGPARADDEDVRVRARAHFKAAEALYEAAEYDQAIVEFQNAYALSKLPELLFNIAQAHRMSHRLEPALDGYRHFIAIKPDGALSDEARSLIAELEAQLGGHGPTAGNGASPSNGAPTHDAAAASHVATASPRANASATSDHADVAPAVAQLSRGTPAPRSPRRRWLVPVVIAGSVAVIAIGVGLGVGLGSGTRYPAASFGEVTPR
jgi:tetratricopeptide (TPR) repeat protein